MTFGDIFEKQLLSEHAYVQYLENINVSISLYLRYIPVDKREGSDQSTHKWMVYVRGDRHEAQIDHFVKKVWFFLHPSYRPNDLVEVRSVQYYLCPLQVDVKYDLTISQSTIYSHIHQNLVS